MNEQSKPTVPGWYWAVAVAALLWNLMGCAAFAMEIFAQEAVMESMSDAMKEWARSVPGWVYVVYGLAVISGVAGSIGLIVRTKWSILLMAICLASVLIQMIYTMLIIGGLQATGPPGLVMPALVITFAAILLWFSWFAKNKGWFVC